MNNISLVGRLVSDPELKYINEDKPFCKFRIAVSRNYRNKDGVIQTDFINIDMWGRKAETFCQYSTKGSLIAVEGSLEIRKYLDKNGENRYYTSIKASNFHFLGHKHSELNNSKLFNDEDLFDDVINENISDLDGLTEDQVPF